MPSLPEELKQYRFFEQLKALPYIEAIYLFGSRARGDHRERSDIDLAVKLRANGSGNWHEVIAIIDEADTLLEIDCVNLDEVDDAFRQRIMSQGKQL